MPSSTPSSRRLRRALALGALAAMLPVAGEAQRTARAESARRPGAADTVRPAAAPVPPVLAPATEPGFLDRVRTRVVSAYEWVRLKLGGVPAPVLPPPGLAADSTSLPTRGALVGVWAHGDRRSSLGDSLTLELRADGAARLVERRFSLDGRNRWSLARPQRTGAWAVRGGAGAELCITWHLPAPVTSSCDPVLRDSVASGRIMTYGGRHWREQRPSEPERAVSRRRRARGSSS